MQERKRTPRLILRRLALIAVAGAVAMGVGLPALLLAEEGTTVSDPEGLRTITGGILGAGFGIGAVLFGLSFLVRGQDG